MIDLYDLGHQHGRRGQAPATEHADQPYYMQGHQAGAEDYRRYRDYLDEGYSRHQAMLMAGLCDPEGEAA